MSKGKEFIKKLTNGKWFYITAAISICVVIAAVGVIYNTSIGMLRNVVIPETTAEVQKNQTGIKDPREPSAVSETTETITEEVTEEKHTNEPSTIITTVKPTEPTFTISEGFVVPVDGEILKEFSMKPVYDETMADWRTHGAVDYLAEEGSPVRAVGNGIVKRVMSDPSWGYIIEIDCGDFIARYCGLQQEGAVKLDSTVKQGDIVGKVGIVPCEIIDDSHLHFEILKADDRIDPMEFFE